MTFEEFLKELRQGESVHFRRSLRSPEPLLIWEVVVNLMNEKSRVYQKSPLDGGELGGMLYAMLLEARQLAETYKDDPYGKQVK